MQNLVNFFTFIIPPTLLSLSESRGKYEKNYKSLHLLKRIAMKHLNVLQNNASYTTIINNDINGNKTYKPKKKKNYTCN